MHLYSAAKLVLWVKLIAHVHVRHVDFTLALASILILQYTFLVTFLVKILAELLYYIFAI